MGSNNKKHLGDSTQVTITSIGYHTDRGAMGLGQYGSLGEYCGPHTASSVFLMILLILHILHLALTILIVFSY